MTYGDLYKEFKVTTNISDELIADYRPCGRSMVFRS